MNISLYIDFLNLCRRLRRCDLRGSEVGTANGEDEAGQKTGTRQESLRG